MREIDNIAKTVHTIIGVYYSITEGLNASKYEDVLNDYINGEIEPTKLLKRITKLLHNDRFITKIATDRYIPTKKGYGSMAYYFGKLQRLVKKE